MDHYIQMQGLSFRLARYSRWPRQPAAVQCATTHQYALRRAVGGDANSGRKIIDFLVVMAAVKVRWKIVRDNLRNTPTFEQRSGKVLVWLSGRLRRRGMILLVHEHTEKTPRQVTLRKNKRGVLPTHLST